MSPSLRPRGASFRTVLGLAGLLASPLVAVSPAPDVEIAVIDERAWAGSSINVVAGTRQALFSDNADQFAAYYDVDGALVLARRLIDGEWIPTRTPHRANVADAHNTASIAIDGDGFLHVAWNHHNVPLNYARSVRPYGTELGPNSGMIGESEARVTYPQFFRMPDGDLLFLYRDGGSGAGALVLNRYDRTSRKWQRLQDILIDGEGERSAYWDLTVDRKGTLHLVWNWRETPDVATNHDLAYARSTDGGRTWTRSDGEIYAMPITAGTAEYAARIPERSNLMNPPFVGADAQGRPFIANYWSPERGARPRFHVVYLGESGWEVLAGPEATTAFSLEGMGTKRPPWSRAVILVEGAGREAAVHLVYRDDALGGRVIGASLHGLGETSEWKLQALTNENVGAWEPSNDPIAWNHAGEAHFLLQRVEQRDGDDREAADVPATPISSLKWIPALRE